MLKVKNRINFCCCLKKFFTSREKKLTSRDDDNGAKESDLGIRQTEAVDPLGQLEDAVHKELGVPCRHRRYRLPSYHIAV